MRRGEICDIEFAGIRAGIVGREHVVFVAATARSAENRGSGPRSSVVVREPVRALARGKALGGGIGEVPMAISGDVWLEPGGTGERCRRREGWRTCRLNMGGSR